MRWLLALVLGLFSTCAWSDGGVLTFVENATTTEESGYYAESCFLETSSEAVLQVENEGEVNATVFNAPAPYTQRFYLTNENPPRLWHDQNGDGKTQSAELSVFKKATNGYQLSTSVQLPVTINSATPIVWVSVNTYSTFFTSKAQYLEFSRILGYYEGTVVIQDKEYPARMYVRSAFPTAHYDNGLVVLDNNEDQQFLLGANLAPLKAQGVQKLNADNGFTSQGLLRLNDALWTAETVCEASTASVMLSPYQGATGKLALAGKGYATLNLEKSAAAEVRWQSAIPLTISGVENQFFTLPVGSYALSNSVLWPIQASTEEYVIVEKDLPQSLRSFTVVSDATITLPIGGPLTSKIQARVNYLTSCVNLSHDRKYTNAAGLAYTTLGKVKSNWELCDADGKLLSSGRFEYG